MRANRKTIFAALLLLTVCASGALAQATNYATLIQCDIDKTTDESSLPDLTWIQGSTPLLELRAVRNGRAVVADTNTKCRIVFAASLTNSSYAVATNYWPATNSASYYIQLGAVGTNTYATNGVLTNWTYTIFFDRAADGTTFWSGSGRLYIIKSTVLGDGLTWISATNLTRVAWQNIDGNPTNNAGLVSYVESTAGADTTARAGVASNAASILAVGAVASNATTEAEAGTIATNVAAVVGAVATNLQRSAPWKLWADESTNYFVRSTDGTLALTSTSFSTALIYAISNAGNAAVVELGPSRISTNVYVEYALDTPVVIDGDVLGGRNGFTLRGHGNYGTTIKVATNYAGELIVLTNLSGIVRFDGIRFDGALSGNTNPCIDSADAAELVVTDCEFLRFAGQSIRHGYGCAASAWNQVSGCFFVGLTNAAPQIDIGTPTDGYLSDFILDGNTFSQHTTNPAVRVGADAKVRSMQIHGNRFNQQSADALTYEAILLASGYGYVVSDNSFNFYNAAGSSCIKFDPASSNAFRAVVAGNNFGYCGATNLIWTDADSHEIQITDNRLGIGGMTIGSGGSVVVMDGYGTTATAAARGDWSAAASNLAAGALPASATNGWEVGSHAGLATEAQAGQIATNVASAGYFPLAGNVTLSNDYVLTMPGFSILQKGMNSEDPRLTFEENELQNLAVSATNWLRLNGLDVLTVMSSINASLLTNTLPAGVLGTNVSHTVGGLTTTGTVSAGSFAFGDGDAITNWPTIGSGISEATAGEIATNVALRGESAPFQIVQNGTTTITVSATSGWMQAFTPTGACQIVFAEKASPANVINIRFDIDNRTNAQILWMTNAPPVSGIPTISTTAVTTILFDSRAGETNFTARELE